MKAGLCLCWVLKRQLMGLSYDVFRPRIRFVCEASFHCQWQYLIWMIWKHQKRIVRNYLGPFLSNSKRITQHQTIPTKSQFDYKMSLYLLGPIILIIALWPLYRTFLRKWNVLSMGNSFLNGSLLFWSSLIMVATKKKWIAHLDAFLKIAECSHSTEFSMDIESGLLFFVAWSFCSQVDFLLKRQWC